MHELVSYILFTRKIEPRSMNIAPQKMFLFPCKLGFAPNMIFSQ
nr:MAG TPA: hypothetical protein [Caudoviricetes sp.]